MFKRLRLWYWKREMLHCHDALECWGTKHPNHEHELLIRSCRSYVRLCREFNHALRKVKELDPTCTVSEMEGV